MTNKQAYAGLLPCPFCGGPPEMTGDAMTGFAVLCHTCGGEGGSDQSYTRAIAAWNTRPEAAEAISSLLKRVGELEGALQYARESLGDPVPIGRRHVARVIDAALNSDAPLSIGEEQ